jgi:hypothetical protein
MIGIIGSSNNILLLLNGCLFVDKDFHKRFFVQPYAKRALRVPKTAKAAESNFAIVFSPEAN